MAARIRPATRDDAPFLARVALLASRSHVERGAWDLWVPESEAERLAFLEALLVGPRSWCHHSIFHVAEVGGEPAAALAGFHEEGDGLAPSAAVLPDVARARGWSDERIASGLRRLAVFVGCLPKDDPRAWSLEWVATLPAFRRRGLVDRLLDVALEAGRRRGHGAADLLILSGNEPARCAYEKHGFRIVDEAHTPEFEAALGCPGLALMRADL